MNVLLKTYVLNFKGHIFILARFASSTSRSRKRVQESTSCIDSGVESTSGDQMAVLLGREQARLWTLNQLSAVPLPSSGQ